jgi:hypothetical protein
MQDRNTCCCGPKRQYHSQRGCISTRCKTCSDKIAKSVIIIRLEVAHTKQGWSLYNAHAAPTTQHEPRVFRHTVPSSELVGCTGSQAADGILLQRPGTRGPARNHTLAHSRRQQPCPCGNPLQPASDPLSSPVRVGDGLLHRHILELLHRPVTERAA